MKRLSTGLIVSLVAITSFAQSNKENNTLLWKISGNGITKASYLFGTVHMICKEDAFLSNNLVNAIQNADRVYLELDMDNLFEMVGAMMKMKMNNDTTLADLLTPEQYKLAKKYFEEKVTMLPFSVLETYKPLVASSYPRCRRPRSPPRNAAKSPCQPRRHGGSTPRSPPTPC